MKFRILEKKYSNDTSLHNNLMRVYTGGNYFIDVDSGYKLFESDNKILIILGDIYHVDRNKKYCAIDLEGILEKSLCDSIPELYHGRYVVIAIDDSVIRVFQDSFSRSDIYYTKTSSIAIASELSLLPINKKTAGYDQHALAQMIISYGNRPSKKQTIYNSVKRLGVLEKLELNNNDITVYKKDFKPVNTRKYTRSDNDLYCDLFLEAIEREGSSDGNLVYLSSGWDSTSIMAGLVHVFGHDKVKVITGRMKYSDRSGVCNTIEMEKVKKFTEYYNVDSEVVDFDYATNGIELVESALPIMKKHGYYNITAVNHWILANASKDIIGDSEQVIFAGEISDGVHNFGYSQYVTLFHPSYGFREYADKMASYLFGPTFLKRIINGDYKEDPVYKLFYTEADFIVDEAKHGEKEINQQLLVDFFLRAGRRPFWSNENIKMLTEEGKKQYTDYHFNEYLSGARIDFDNLYSYYLHLYNSFHWQGSTVAPLQTIASEFGLKSCMPFWDKHIQNFLSEMPEDWGRGLDLNHTKYPLKWMLEHKLDYPIELQDGPHSYTYDTDHSFNHYEEILRQSSLASDVMKTINDYDFEGVLSEGYFNASYIDGLKSKFISGVDLTGVQLNEIASLYFLAKVD